MSGPIVPYVSAAPRKFRSWQRFLLAFLLFAPLGCGGETLYPVEGTVSVDGTPLAKGSVILWAEKPSAEQPGAEVENGKFRVMTKGKAGAPEGKYKITVNGKEEIDSTKPFKTKLVVPPAYRDQAKTPLTVQVGPSQATTNVEWSVKSK